MLVQSAFSLSRQVSSHNTVISLISYWFTHLPLCPNRKTVDVLYSYYTNLLPLYMKLPKIKIKMLNVAYSGTWWYYNTGTSKLIYRH